MDKYKVCSSLTKAPPNFGSSAAFNCQFCQTLRYQNRSKGLVCHYEYMYFLKNVNLVTIIDMHINHNLLIFRPDFDASREKLRKLGDAEGTLTKEEFNKMKQELEAEYLATFKKTVAMHETFLCRLARCVLTFFCSVDILKEVLLKFYNKVKYKRF